MRRERLLLRLCLGLFLFLAFHVSKAQEKTVTGTVTDDKGSALSGASVTPKGAVTGVTTDASGKFSLTLQSGIKSVIISYVGFESQEIAIKDRSSMTILLKPVNTALNEVVVIGYGTQKRKDVTGSVSSVKGESFKNQPVTNVTEALQGRAAGVEIIKSSGQPGAGPIIRIRGITSLNQPDPLYIVDGVQAPANSINVQDIASIDILKDASATSIYGAAAAGGVIVVTTKKGAAGLKPTINFNARYGVSKPKLVQLLDKDGWIKLQNIVNPRFFTGATQTDTLADTDWSKLIYRDATEQNYNLSIVGSTPAVNYYVSGFYNAQKGILIRNYQNTGGIRVNTDFKLAKFLKVGEQLFLSAKKGSPPVGAENAIHNAPFRSMPVIPLYNSEGGWGGPPSGYNGLSFGGPNPYGAIQSANALEFSNDIYANVFADIKLPFYLSFKSNVNYSTSRYNRNAYQGTYNFGAVINNTNSLNKYWQQYDQVLYNNVLTFDHTFGKHSINAIAGYEQITNRLNSINATQTNVGLNGYSFLQTSTSNNSVSGTYDPQGLVKSYFARLNYNFDSRYYVSGSIRQDANYTVFGPGEQKGVFPSVSAGWNISDETFFKSVTIINRLKIRGSYGEFGNSSIGSYRYLSTYGQFDAYNAGVGLAGARFSNNGTMVVGTTVNSLANPNLHWETVKASNIGIEGEALKNKLSFTVEWYNKTTDGVLYNLPVPASTGITSSYATNIGVVSSRGVDIQLGYRDRAGDFGYDISVTGAFNKSKVVSLTEETNNAIYAGFNPYSSGDNGFSMMSNQSISITKAGIPFGSFYGYKVLGIFQTDADAAKATWQPGAKAGDLMFAHDSKNGGILSSEDRQVIGNPNPKFVYGASIRLDYKGFDLNLLINGVAGVDIFNGVKAYEMSLFADGNSTSKIFGNSFLDDNGLTSQPRLGIKNPDGSFTLDPNKNYSSVNSYFVEKGDYFKLKNVQLGYTFNSSQLSKTGIKNARLFIMANNVFTITKYSGLDPELGGGVTSRGIDGVSQYPQVKLFSVGLDINF